MRRTLAIPAALMALAACSGDTTRPRGGVLLDIPTNLTSVSLNTAIQLSWDANARVADPGAFGHYNVYSTSYNLDTGVCDNAGWALEGSSVSEDFLVTGLTNGVSLCFSVTAVSTDGTETSASSSRPDTPRYDSRNVRIDASQRHLGTSGFRFDFGSGQLGQVLSGDRNDLDFVVDLHSDGSLWMTTVRSGTSVVLYSQNPVVDLTSIDVAPVSGYVTGSIEAVTGYAYVFETNLSDGLHYGALRVTAVGSDYIIVDWAYQTDYGNPELRRVVAGGGPRP